MKRGQKRKDPSTRFWNKVKKGSGCWEWTGFCNPYGRFNLGGRYGKIVSAHRFAWTIIHGEVPISKIVCHTCDNPKCVKLEHLVLGTHKYNTQDALSKGRMAVGEKAGRSKLKDSDVVSIRKDIRSYRKIAADYAISGSCVGQIKTGKRWKHIPEDTSDAPTIERENKPQDSETTRHIQVRGSDSTPDAGQAG